MDQQIQEPATSLFQLNLDATNTYTLRSSASWAKVLGIVGILLGIIFILLCVIALVKLSEVSGYRSYKDEGFADIFGRSQEAKVGLWILILTGVVFILGGVFSFNFGNKINAALKSNSQEGLNNAFAALRNYYALRSITLIIVLLLFLISFAGTL